MFGIETSPEIKQFIKHYQYGGGFDEIKTGLLQTNNIIDKYTEREGKNASSIIDEKLQEKLDDVKKTINDINTTKTNIFTSDYVSSVNNSNVLNNIELMQTNISKFKKNIIIGLYATPFIVPIDSKPIEELKTIEYKSIELQDLINTLFLKFRTESVKIDERTLQNHIIDIGKKIVEMDIIDRRIVHEIKTLTERIDYMNVADPNNKFHAPLYHDVINNTKSTIDDKEFTIEYTSATQDITSYTDIFENALLTRAITGVEIKKSHLDILTNLVKTTDEKFFKKTPQINKRAQVNLLYNPQSKDDFERATEALSGGGTYDRIIDRLKLYNKKKDAFDANITKYKKFINMYNTSYVNWIIHHIYLLSTTTQLYTKEKYVMYKYVNYGTIVYYIRILHDVINKFRLRSQDIALMYMKKYHYNTVYILYYFLRNLKNRMRKDVLNTNFVRYYAKEAGVNIYDDPDKQTSNFKLSDIGNEEKENKIMASYIKGVEGKISNLVDKRLDNIKQFEADFKNAKIDYRSIKYLDFAESKIIDVFHPNTHTYIKSNLVLFSHFVPILDTYVAMFQTKVSTYARINDKQKLMYSADRVFDVHPKTDNFQDLVVSIKNCSIGWPIIQAEDPSYEKILNDEFTKLGPNYSIQFSEILDSKTIPDNDTIAKYMALSKRLQDGNSTMILTYGYSGTGKTYTMFGSSKPPGKQGVLQETLRVMPTFESAKYRIFELYGLGVAFDYYWSQDKTKIYQKLYTYDLRTDGGLLRINGSSHEMSDLALISEYIKSNIDGFADINNLNLFNKFDTFMDTIDKERQKKKRVRETPNNPESSRSILIHDFRIKLLDRPTPVTFIIIDLPGREELIDSYCNPTIKFMNEIGAIPPDMEIQYKYILTSMILNPLSMAMIYPDATINVVNNSSYFNTIVNEPITRNLQLGSSIPLTMLWPEFNKYATSQTVHFNNITIRQTNVTFSKEILYAYGKLIISVEDVIDLSHNQITFKYNTKSSHIIITNRVDSDFPLHVLVAMSLIYRIIKTNKFELLDQIAKEICKKSINHSIYDILEGKKKPDDDLILNALRKARGLYFQSYIETIKDMDNVATKTKYTQLMTIKKTANDISNADIQALNANPTFSTLLTKSTIDQLSLSYTYTTTPYEGIYINENIVGLMAYLLSNANVIPVNINEIVGDIGDSKKPITLQDNENLTIETVAKNTYDLLLYNYTADPKVGFDKIEYKDWPTNYPIFDGVSKTILWKPIYIKRDALDKEFKTAVSTYKSDRLFKKDDIMLKVLLEPYLTDIKDFKIFYLVNNDNDKCGAQLKLLIKTAKILKNFYSNK